MITAFDPKSINVDLTDLKNRLRNTRWTDSVTSDWSYGTEAVFLKQLVGYWAETYDWQARSARISAMPHFRSVIDDFGVHFLHYRSEASDAIPLLLVNGWPSSFLEFQRLVPLLIAGSPSFNVVIPALPGFGFSDRPTLPYQVEAHDLFPHLMEQLGYERFFVAGTDIGSGVVTRIALHSPSRVMGAHISAVAPKPRGPQEATQSVAELEYEKRAAIWNRDEGGYQALQTSRPQSLAFALADSPTGMAAWIVEKFRAWSDCGGDVLSVWSQDELLDNLMVYWITNTIGSSVRYYFDGTRLRPQLTEDAFVTVPTFLAVWPHDLASPPRELAERLYNVARYSKPSSGGHFPAWEKPELYAEEIRSAVGTVFE